MQQTALITGAARNIGKGITKTLLNAGYRCIAVDVDEQALRQAVAELGANQDHCLTYAADISDVEQIERLYAWLGENDMQLTALINNAAYESPVGVRDINHAELQRSFSTNLIGPFLLTSLVANGWIQNKATGSVVFTSSVHSQLIRTHALYSPSKAAIEMFVKEAAVELGAEGIRVNAVAPGPTEDTETLKPDYRVPLGYAQQPLDIAEAVKFLISDEARFITGQSLVVDGGFSLTHVHHWHKTGRLPA